MEGKNMAKKGNRELIKMVSTLDSGYFYVTSKNKRNQKEKLELEKYDPYMRQKCKFKESKMK